MSAVHTYYCIRTDHIEFPTTYWRIHTFIFSFVHLLHYRYKLAIYSHTFVQYIRAVVDKITGAQGLSVVIVVRILPLTIMENYGNPRRFKLR